MEKQKGEKQETKQWCDVQPSDTSLSAPQDFAAKTKRQEGKGN